MSAIADFIRLPASAVEPLRSDYDQTLQRYGQPAASYAWSGHVLATLLSYLDEHGIKLMESPYDPRSSCRLFCSATFAVCCGLRLPSYVAAQTKIAIETSQEAHSFDEITALPNAPRDPNIVAQCIADARATVFTRLQDEVTVLVKRAADDHYYVALRPHIIDGVFVVYVYNPHTKTIAYKFIGDNSP